MGERAYLTDELRQLRILVIDDDPCIRDCLRLTLEYAGYEIIAAQSGADGLALVERWSPDLVLLDIEMPGMDGLDVLRQLRATHESLPVVMMSAHCGAPIVAGAKRAGAVDFLEKPFENTDRLLAAIQRAI